MPLRQLYPDLENTAEDEAIVDIVAVHGLNPRSKPDQDHAWDTWRTPAGPQGKLWLRDELPKELPHARIFLYEYNSTAVYGRDRTTFIDKVNAFLEELRIDRRKDPRRPLLLLGHSLGGLLIKQALINAHNNDKYTDIKDSTQGLAFFATPHDGGKQSLVNLGNIASKIALELGFQKGDNILETLKSGSMFSDLMHEHWRHRLLEYPIVSFWGTLDTIVPRESTSFGLPGKHENVVSLQAGHGGVCKFGTSLQDRDNFKLVQANIQDLYESAIANGQCQPDQNPEMKEKLQRVEKAEELLRSLYKSLYSDAKDRNPQRVQGTCEWFTSHGRFQDWKNGKTCGLLWVSADPGCGKSVLSKYLVDEVLQSTSTSTTCYFFFKDDFEDQKSAAGALCCLLRQLFKQRPALLQDSILKQYEEDGDKLLSSFRELWRILISVSRHHGNGQIVCVLDALDECEQHDRRLLVQTLNDFYLKKDTKANLKFLVTSRPYVHIERGFNDIQTKLPMIHLRGEGESESNKIAKEIDLVVGARVTQLRGKLQLTKDEEKAMRRGMTQNPNRTYLWVYLVFELLEGCVGHSVTQIEEHIGNIPPTVDDAYEKILSKSPDKKKARKLLQMVVAAKRPLNLREMAVAMSIEKNHTTYSQLKIEPKERLRWWVRELCGLFVSIVDDKVYLLHQTAAEFLVERPGEDARGDLPGEDNSRSEWKCSFSPASSNLTLGSVCAQLLLFTDVVDATKPIGHADIDARFLRDLGREYPLLTYSLEHWATHLGEAGDDRDLPLSNMLQLCSGSESACFMRQLGSGYYMHAKVLTPLAVASTLRLAAVTKHLLKLESTDANERDPKFKEPPLFWALRGGCQAVLDTFIEAENRYQKKKRHPLKRLLMKLLLRKCYVDFDARSQNKGMELSSAKNYPELKSPTTPLGWAVHYEDECTVRKLLKTGCVTVTREMLFAAAMDDNENILRALLDAGQVTVRCKAKNGRHLLNWALKHSAFRVTKYLLGTGMFDLVREMQPWKDELSCLAYAAKHGADELLRLLLAKGEVDFDFTNDSSQGRTPLSFAAEAGAQEFVRLLLATGKVTVDRKDWRGWTAVSYAAEMGHEGIVQQLLATGKVEVDSTDWRDCTPLHYAAMGGHEGIVQQLLASGKVDVNGRGPFDQTPLHYAAMGGHEGIVQQLLASGKAEVNSGDSDGWTPLHYAARWGHEGIVQQLLATGKVDVNSRDQYSQTPLHHAAEEGHEGVVRQLVAVRADITAKDMVGDTPFTLAVQCGFGERMRHLLDVS